DHDYKLYNRKSEPPRRRRTRSTGTCQANQQRLECRGPVIRHQSLGMPQGAREEQLVTQPIAVFMVRPCHGLDGFSLIAGAKASRKDLTAAGFQGRNLPHCAVITVMTIQAPDQTGSLYEFGNWFRPAVDATRRSPSLEERRQPIPDA